MILPTVILYGRTVSSLLTEENPPIAFTCLHVELDMNYNYGRWRYPSPPVERLSYTALAS